MSWCHVRLYRAGLVVDIGMAGSVDSDADISAGTKRKDPMSITTADTSAEGMRAAMIAKVKDAGYELSRSAEEAMRTVERHLFVPDASLVDAYANDIVVTKRADGGEVLSCLSQPSIVALQLSQLDARPGHRILEIGAGGGYNAALLAHLVGPHGAVMTIDVDADIVADARHNLHAAGVTNVEVVHGDGALGHPDGAPYDRIVATVGAYGIPDSWLSPLAPAGRLVVPLRIRGGVSRSIAFERADDSVWRSVDHQMCGFLPLRHGAADDPRRTIALTSDRTVTLQFRQEHSLDPSRLVGVLDEPRAQVWTDVRYGPMQSLEWLYLWLTCVLDGGLCSMTVGESVLDAGLVDPMFRWGAMAVAGDRELAYLTWRPVADVPGGRVMQTGVVAHGPRAADLADRVAAEIQAWDERFRHRNIRFEIPWSGAAVTNPQEGRFFLDRPHNPITVIWENHDDISE